MGESGISVHEIVSSPEFREEIAGRPYPSGSLVRHELHRVVDLVLQLSPRSAAPTEQDHLDYEDMLRDVQEMLDAMARGRTASPPAQDESFSMDSERRITRRRWLGVRMHYRAAEATHCYLVARMLAANRPVGVPVVERVEGPPSLAEALGSLEREAAALDLHRLMGVRHTDVRGWVEEKMTDSPRVQAAIERFLSGETVFTSDVGLALGYDGEAVFVGHTPGHRWTNGIHGAVLRIAKNMGCSSRPFGPECVLARSVSET
jgi:hypothetical protein